MSYEQLLAYLGKPLVFREMNADGTFTVYYDHLLVFFYQHELHLFQIEFQDYIRGPLKNQRDSLPVQFGADWYAAVKQMRIEDFMAYAKSHEIKCARLMTDERNVLWLEEGQLDIIFFGGDGSRTQYISGGRGDRPANWQFEPC